MHPFSTPEALFLEINTAYKCAVWVNKFILFKTMIRSYLG